jgi:hypothetical protein
LTWKKNALTSFKPGSQRRKIAIKTAGPESIREQQHNKPLKKKIIDLEELFLVLKALLEATTALLSLQK